MCGHLRYGVELLTTTILAAFAGKTSVPSHNSDSAVLATENLYSPVCGARSQPRIRAEKFVAICTGVSSALSRIPVWSGGVEKSLLPVHCSRISPLPAAENVA